MRTKGMWIIYCPGAGLQICPGAVCCPTGASGKKFWEKYSKKKFSQKFFPQLKFSENLKFFFFKFFLNKNFLKKNHFKKFSPKFFTRIFPSPPNFILILQTVLQFKLISTSIRLTGLTGRTATL